MLTKRYLAIKRLLTAVSKIDVLHPRLKALAQMYIDIDRGYRYSYMPDENGETELLDTIAGTLDRKLVFFDVGSHFGTYTQLVLDRFADCEGHLFEPTRTTYEESLRRLNGDGRLHISNLALSDAPGEVEYRVYPDDPSRNGIAGVGLEKNFDCVIETAVCATGDDYCRDSGIGHIDLLKIDAEGYDLHVLKGLHEMLAQQRIDVIQFEYTAKHTDTRVMLRDYYDFLGDNGYVLGPLRPEGIAFIDTFDFRDNGFEFGPNYIACRAELRPALERFGVVANG